MRYSQSGICFQVEMLLPSHSRGSGNNSIALAKCVLDVTVDRDTLLQHPSMFVEALLLNSLINREDYWQICISDLDCSCCRLCLKSCLGIDHADRLTMREDFTISEELLIFY